MGRLTGGLGIGVPGVRRFDRTESVVAAIFRTKNDKKKAFLFPFFFGTRKRKVNLIRHEKKKAYACAWVGSMFSFDGDRSIV